VVRFPPTNGAKIDWPLLFELLAFIGKRCGGNIKTPRWRDVETPRYLAALLQNITRPPEQPRTPQRRRGPHPATKRIVEQWEGLVTDLKKRHKPAEARRIAAEVFEQSRAYGAPPAGQDAVTWIESKVKYARRSMRRRGGAL
jgi:hypothetical protein